jgi:hypothetical protein
VLDRLVAEGVINPQRAKRLRQIALGADRELSKADISRYAVEFMMLLSALMLPDRRDARSAVRRNFALALQHAYYEAVGEPSATKRTAQASGMSRRTVSDAVRKSPRVAQLIPTIINMMRSPDSWRDKRDSTAVIRRMMLESPQTLRSPELRQALAALRKRLPAPRVGNKTP